MTRFVMLLAIAAVAGVMYVAAAPGGLTRSGPTNAQFKALSKKVTALQKQVTSLKNEANAAIGIEALCIMHAPLGVDQVGTSTSGYLFGPPQTAPNAVTATATSALNVSTGTTPQHRLFALNTSEPDCVKLANTASTQAAKRYVAPFAQR